MNKYFEQFKKTGEVKDYLKYKEDIKEKENERRKKRRDYPKVNRLQR